MDIYRLFWLYGERLMRPFIRSEESYQACVSNCM